jgi:hypothetical protein
MKLSPIKDIEVPFFKDGTRGGSITLLRGEEEEVTVVRHSHDSVVVILESEPDRIECKVPTRFIQLY